MNKVSLFTLGKKLQDNNLYLLSIYDLEPSGIIIHAYDQSNSRELILPVSEFELLSAGISRSTESLTNLINTIELVTQGTGLVLQSTNDNISKIQHRLTGQSLQKQITKDTLDGTHTINDILVAGLVELCKVKPVGTDGVKWLGEWLLENNPNKPVVSLDE